MNNDNPAITVGVVTHQRSTLFANLLKYLGPAIRHHDGHCELLVVNNSGDSARTSIEAIIDASGIADVCTVNLLDSPENNIATGRNLILDNVKTPILIFVDDDEYPVENWISDLLAQHLASGHPLVAGPIVPVYPQQTPAWVASLDLHNKDGLKSGDLVRRVATGNCLLDMTQIGSHRFDRDFGLSGGSDALFFEQLAEQGHRVVWSETAIVHETIPEKRTSSRYMIFRCMTQGQNFKRIKIRNADPLQKLLFHAKALLVAPASLLIGTFALPFNASLAAKWLKRGFTNLGKIIKPARTLYG